MTDVDIDIDRLRSIETAARELMDAERRLATGGDFDTLYRARYRAFEKLRMLVEVNR